MRSCSACKLLQALLLVLLLTACSKYSHPGQPYPDAPAPFKADDHSIAASNYAQLRNQPFTLGLGILNEGSTPITLDSITPVEMPSSVTLVATAIKRPEENGYFLLTAGNLGYPPIIGKLHRPYIFHLLKHAIVWPQEYIAAMLLYKVLKQVLSVSKASCLPWR